MSNTESLQRVFPSPHGTADIMCPECEKYKKIDVQFLISPPRPLEMNCDCGKMYQVILDTRVFPRKATLLSGMYTPPHAKASELMTVVDLSFVGARFRTKTSHDLKAGDIVNMTFDLDNKSCSKVSKTAVVRHVSDFEIGAEFCEQEAFDTVLAYYLNPY